MKTGNILFKALAFFIISVSMWSCKKDVSGCTDPSADNFKTDANVEDGSCTFHGYLTPWYDTTTRDSLLANNVASVGVYVDGAVFTNIYPASVLWSAEPECSTNTVGNWITMQNTKSKSINVLVKALDSSNNEVRQWTETMTIESGTCKFHQIIW